MTKMFVPCYKTQNMKKLASVDNSKIIMHLNMGRLHCMNFMGGHY